ncbi:heavy-metal-associated domain-containing protein [Flavobacterium sp.]|jgi:mercuric ion binding protein|uniref:heavy-metal-associated domain-containing protein n=1 Tax=Flavobacterium sp. TaxID=239 RepID=UPI0040483F61
MKKIIMVLLVGLFSLVSFSQEKKSKNKQVSFKVTGNCEMCEKKIEKAAFSIKGVKSADWKNDEQNIFLIIDETKCSALDVANAIAKVGYDSELVKANDEDYDNLHGCCQYKRD